MKKRKPPRPPTGSRRFSHVSLAFLIACATLGDKSRQQWMEMSSRDGGYIAAYTERRQKVLASSGHLKPIGSPSITPGPSCIFATGPLLRLAYFFVSDTPVFTVCIARSKPFITISSIASSIRFTILGNPASSRFEILLIK